MEFGYYRERLTEDTTGKFDVTPLFADREVFGNLVDDLSAPLDEEHTHVAGIEALGFVLGGAVAERGGLGFVAVRKSGKLPLRDEDCLRETTEDYTGEERTLELGTDLLGPGDRVLLVDDWVETGGQMHAAAALVERAGATVAGVSVLRAEKNERSEALFEQYDVHSIG